MPVNPLKVLVEGQCVWMDYAQGESLGMHEMTALTPLLEVLRENPIGWSIAIDPEDIHGPMLFVERDGGVCYDIAALEKGRLVEA
jgi:hypothetical protein